ncbi:hypothetical protein [uncultured Methylobacterium sp.]|uniref:hypothetical protein n=1 Tax=uncultured Methylobacterium sp. TaxID=157278 RepID=UPI0035CB991A
MNTPTATLTPEPPDGGTSPIKPTAPRRVRRAAQSRRKLRVYYTMGPKGGLGKTFTARALLDLVVTLGRPVRIVQIDRGTVLPDLYPGLAQVVHPPGAEEMRADPLAAIKTFAPLEEAVERCLDDGADLFVDVGAAQNARAFLSFLAKSRFDAYLAGHGVSPIALLLFTAEVSAMTQSADLAEILTAIHPGAEIVPVLNERDGPFSFREASQAGRIWRERVVPLLTGRRQVVIPAMAAGAWAAFEEHGLTFRDVIESDERALGRQIGEGRAMTAALQGDVAAWIDVVWTALTPLLAETCGGEVGDAGA